MVNCFSLLAKVITVVLSLLSFKRLAGNQPLMESMPDRGAVQSTAEPTVRKFSIINNNNNNNNNNSTLIKNHTVKVCGLG